MKACLYELAYIESNMKDGSRMHLLAQVVCLGLSESGDSFQR